MKLRMSWHFCVVPGQVLSLEQISLSMEDLVHDDLLPDTYANKRIEIGQKRY